MARQMKDSGIEWIGEIPETWKIRKHKTLFDCSKEIVGEASATKQLLSLTTHGIRKKGQEASTGKVPESFDTYQTVTPNDIVMCLFDLDCSAVFSGISPCAGMISPAYKVIKCKSETYPLFADYWFRFVFDGRKFKTYAKNLRYTLTYDEFATLSLALPPLEEQHRIADFLDRKCAEIDVVIERTKATIDEYKKLKQAVITEAVTKGVRGNRSMKDSGIEWVPELPVEWTIIPSKFLFRDSDVRRLPDDEQLTASQKYGIISQTEYIEREGAKVVLANKGLKEWKHVEPNDFIISLRSFQGGLEMSEVSGCITWHYIVLKPCKAVFSRYFKWLFKSEVYIKALQRTCNFIRDGQDLRYSNFVQVPLYEPSLEEQQEIADYLDVQCAEMDTLIAKKTALLTELETYKKSLIYEYVTGKTECIDVQVQEQAPIVYPSFPAAINTDKPRFAQAVLMSKILDSNVKQMGRVKLEKMLYTIETSIGFDFDTEYAREAAGPLHSSIYECEGIIGHKNKWFTMKQSQYGVSYTPTSSKDKYKKYYDKYFSEYATEIDRIISVFRDYTMDQAEIVATLFAAWNDAIIGQKHFTDEDIVDDVLNNWHESKKRFPRDVWLRAMEQMRKNNLVPKGYGKRTVIKTAEV